MKAADEFSENLHPNKTLRIKMKSSRSLNRPKGPLPVIDPRFRPDAQASQIVPVTRISSGNGPQPMLTNAQASSQPPDAPYHRSQNRMWMILHLMKDWLRHPRLLLHKVLPQTQAWVVMWIGRQKAALWPTSWHSATTRQSLKSLGRSAGRRFTN